MCSQSTLAGRGGGGAKPFVNWAESNFSGPESTFSGPESVECIASNWNSSKFPFEIVKVFPPCVTKVNISFYVPKRC